MPTDITSISPDVVVLANGAFPTGDAPLNFLRQAKRLVCCDGATNKAVSHDFTPDVVVGDLDSISPQYKAEFKDLLVHVEDQECNDLSKAFRHCINQGWKNIVIVGATGEREDHTIGNVSLLADFALEADSVQMVTDSGVFYAATKSGTFHTVKGQQISIFSLDPRQEITSAGLKYPLRQMRLPRWNMATLNEALDDVFSLEFSSESPLILFFANPGIH